VNRSLWFVAGAGAGVYAMVRGRRAAEALTVDGLRDRLGGLAVGARMFRDEVSSGRAEKETELRHQLGLVPHGLEPHGRAEIAAGRHRREEGSS
jgi:uncharacterized protein DUF6167